MADRGKAKWSGQRAASIILRYGSALVSVAAAFGLAHIFLHFDLPQPFTAFALCAIALGFWYGGTKPGILAALLSMVVRGYFFDPETNIVSRVLYDLVFLVFAVLMAQVTRARNELEVKVADRTSELTRANEALKLEIAERKQAESNLRRNEAFLSDAQKLSHTGSWRHDVASGAITVSPEVYRIHDIKPDEDASNTEFFFGKFHPEDRKRVVDLFERAEIEKIEFQVDYRIVLPDGTIKHLHTIGHPVLNESGDLVEFVGTAMDVTAAKQAEEALRQSENYLAEAQRLSHTGSFGWSVSTGEIIWSDETLRIFRYDRTRKPTLELILQRVHPEDLTLVKQTIESAAQNGKDFEHQYRLVMPDGEVKHVHVVAHAKRDESGENEFVGAVMDVSERERADEDLRQSEARAEEHLRLVVDTTPAMINSCRPDGYLDYVNKGWLDYLGFSLETALDRADVMKMSLPSKADVSGGKWEPIIHPEDLVAFRDHWKATLASGKPGEFEGRVRRFDGMYRWHLFRGVPLCDETGKLVKWYISAFDIEDRKRAEALRDAESRILEMIARDAPLEQILEQLVRVVEAQFAGLVCSVLLLDVDGQHVRHGAAPSLPLAYTEAIDGLCIGPKAGSCGTAMYRREPVVVTDILEDPLWELYRGAAEPYGFRACWSTPILAPSGKALGSFAMYYREPRSPSPAETHALEMATHLAGIAIERKLAREERERLRQAQADLAHINRVTTMGELTASLAHEVNQPIAAAVTNANTCLRWLTRDQPDVEEARAAAMRIVKDGTRAAEIIKRIRLLFKKGTLERELVDVNEVIREMTVLLRGEATRYSVSVRMELAADLPRVMGDRVQLQQVMMNLMINAIDAMKEVDGTRELAIKSQRAEDEQLLVSVSDTGVGLPSQQTDQIFKAFFTTKLHGTGMGLSISRSIVESHGGRLRIGGNSPRGASFQFTLPTKVEAHE
jgi:PAS domain S-box-containing protein